jgi:2-keto-3-deoxy-L-rhamnonate aldolase RhmA
VHDPKTLTRFLELGRSGRRPLGVCCSIYAPEIVEMVGRAGFEWVLINQEHTFINDARAVSNMVRAADLYNLFSLVKLPRWDPVLARDAVDAGAYGVQVPFVHDAKMLREVLAGFRYPPLGRRGYCDVSRAMGYNANTIDDGMEASHFSFVNSALVVPYIESAEAVANLDELLAVEECPIYALGVADLALVVPSDKLQSIVADVVQRVKAADKMLMSFMPPPRVETADKTASLLTARRIDYPVTSEMECMYASFGVAQRIRDKTIC